ncbi:hypothetical protein [Ancylobacter amanitiformis]|uniref:Uncharacterized protein n=1 Tax=Ancylobacter amanitiformis TaxID=217069 RepID=A0ABU0LSK1_9HYPH|nr:hypothetical protein [Ancylobacter amanitiformis]MDQ0511686.1 hypothetical protein [Ancylobacter amanitiformis]
MPACHGDRERVEIRARLSEAALLEGRDLRPTVDVRADLFGAPAGYLARDVFTDTGAIAPLRVRLAGIREAATPVLAASTAHGSMERICRPRRSAGRR